LKTGSSAIEIKVFLRHGKIEMNEHLRQFDIARKLYPGSKVGNANEFKNFVYRSMYPNKPKCKYDIRDVLPLLAPAIKKQIQWRLEAKISDFRPPWKNFQTWINDNYWEFEPPLVAVMHAPKTCCVCGEPASTVIGNKRYCPKDNPYGRVKFIKPEERLHRPNTSNQVMPEERLTSLAGDKSANPNLTTDEAGQGLVGSAPIQSTDAPPSVSTGARMTTASSSLTKMAADVFKYAEGKHGTKKWGK
jgi:hypothetical protein